MFVMPPHVGAFGINIRMEGAPKKGVHYARGNPTSPLCADLVVSGTYIYYLCGVVVAALFRVLVSSGSSGAARCER